MAAFDHGQGAYKVPATLTFTNQSTKATSFSWSINGEEVSTDDNLVYEVLESGRYDITLVASDGGKTTSKSKTIYVAPPDNCTVLLETDSGNIILELLEETSAHLTNFTELVDSGFYDGLIFHRVIDDFMIQGGGNEYRTKGKKFADPPTVREEINTDFPHYRGALAAARMPDNINPDKASSGSQFYIVDGRKLDAKAMEKFQASKLFSYTEEQIQRYTAVGGAPQLDGEYTVFGYMLSGYEVLDRIAESITDSYDKPVQDITILRARSLN